MKRVLKSSSSCGGTFTAVVLPTHRKIVSMLDHSLVVKRQITINASPERVWFVLTNPSMIARYLYGASVVTDWKVGSEILFQGDFEGTKWQDKGVIREFVAGSRLAYDYWSGSCGLADLPANYSRVTFAIRKSENGAELLIEQDGYATLESFESSSQGWDAMLASIRSIAEE